MPQDVGRMGFYFGPVGGLGFWDEEYYWYDEFGIALRVGITGGYQWEFPVIPLQLYLELNPVGEIHFLSWDGHHANDKHDPDYAYRDDSDTQWKMPDFYLRLGLRFWF